MAKEIIPALMAWHIGTRPVFLCRPGQTMSGILTDGEDYVAKKKINYDDSEFLDMSSNSRRRGFRNDSLGSTGIQFREDLLDFVCKESHAFMCKRASVRDMAFTGTSINGLGSPDSVRAMPHGDLLGSQHHPEPEHRDPFPLKILTSTMPRAHETVNWPDNDFNINQMSNLNPLDKGDFAGLEIDEIQKVNPGWYSKLEKDPFDTR
jgi:hypothetical protein